MNVYPENMLELILVLSSIPMETNKSIRNVYHPYLDVTAEFPSSEVVITGDWGISYPFLCTHFIIGNTNVNSYRLVLKDVNGDTVFDSDTVILQEERIHIKNMPGPLAASSFILTADSYEEITFIGFLYLGSYVKLPKFLVNPVWSFGLQSESIRSAAGHAYGLWQPVLESFSVTFPRINNEELKRMKRYIQTVLNIKPHIVAPYTKARDEFEPFYATLTSGIEPQKRNEDGFYWENISLSWQEAK